MHIVHFIWYQELKDTHGSLPFSPRPISLILCFKPLFWGIMLRNSVWPKVNWVDWCLSKSLNWDLPTLATETLLLMLCQMLHIMQHHKQLRRCPQLQWQVAKAINELATEETERQPIELLKAFRFSAGKQETYSLTSMMSTDVFPEKLSHAMWVKCWPILQTEMSEGTLEIFFLQTLSVCLRVCACGWLHIWFIFDLNRCFHLQSLSCTFFL